MPFVVANFGLILLAAVFFGLGFFCILRKRVLLAFIPFFFYSLVHTFMTTDDLYVKALWVKALASAILAVLLTPMMYGLIRLWERLDRLRSRAAREPEGTGK